MKILLSISEPGYSQQIYEDRYDGLWRAFIIYGDLSGVVIVSLSITIIILCLEKLRKGKPINSGEYINQQPRKIGEKDGNKNQNEEDPTEKPRPERSYTETNESNKYEELRQGVQELRDYEALRGGGTPAVVRFNDKGLGQVPDTRIEDHNDQGASYYEELKDVRVDNVYEHLRNERDAEYTNTQLL